jgi:hypothetical protein
VAAIAEPGPPDPDLTLPDDRLHAMGAAYTLLEELQGRPADPRLHARLDRSTRDATAAGWTEVRVVLLFTALVHADLVGRSPDELRVAAADLLSAALAHGDEVLVTLAVAARPAHLSDSGRPEPFGDDLAGCLAHAVATLEELSATAAERGSAALQIPAAYVECGQAYRRLDLWELEMEMYERAEAALSALYPRFGPSAEHALH